MSKGICQIPGGSFFPDNKFGRFAKCSLGLDGLMTKNVPLVLQTKNESFPSMYLPIL
jgi:hypothetical protein